MRKASQQAKSQSLGKWVFLEWAPPGIVLVASREDVEAQRRLIGGGRNDAQHWSTTARLRQRATHPRPSPHLDQGPPRMRQIPQGLDRATNGIDPAAKAFLCPWTQLGSVHQRHHRGCQQKLPPGNLQELVSTEPKLT